MTAIKSFLSDCDYQTNNMSLFEQAFTHRSFSYTNNERLEFLGDAMLDLVIGEALFRQFPDRSEGILSRYRAILVNGDALASVAREININACLRLGAGEKKSGGNNRDSILADAFEAFLGAVYLDAGFDACKSLIMKFFNHRLSIIDATASNKDAKTALQELMQSKHQRLPQYTLKRTQGKQHEQMFFVECSLPSTKKVVEAPGRSKKMAEQAAAELMLEKMDREQY